MEDTRGPPRGGNAARRTQRQHPLQDARSARWPRHDRGCLRHPGQICRAAAAQPWRASRLQGRADLGGDADILRDRPSDCRRRAREPRASIGRQRRARGLRPARPRIRNRGSLQVGRSGQSAAVDRRDDRAAHRRRLRGDRTRRRSRRRLRQPRRALAGRRQFLECRHRAVGIRRPDGPIFRRVLGRASQNGASVGEGYGRDILGHPFNSAAWLATQLNSRGASLKAGQIVMTGSVMKTVFPEQAASFRFDLGGIGVVEVQVR